MHVFPYFSILWTVISLLFVPLLVVGRTVISQRSYAPQQAAERIHLDASADSPDTAKQWATSNSPLSFSLPNGEETYQIVIDSHPRHFERPSCSEDELRNVRINGQSLSLTAIDGSFTKTVHLSGTVFVQDDFTGRERSVSLILGAACFPTADEDFEPERHEVTDHLWKSTTPVLGISLFLILDIDGQYWSEDPFTVAQRLVNGHVSRFSVHQPTKPFLHSKPVPDEFLEQFPPQPTPTAPSPTVQTFQPTLPSAQSEQNTVALASHSDATSSDDREVATALQKLKELRNNLEASQNAVKEQEQLVHSLLGKSNFKVVAKEAKPCGIKQPVCLIKRLSLECRQYLEQIFSFDSSTDPKDCHGINKMNDVEKAKLLADGAYDCKTVSQKNSLDFADDDPHQPLLSPDSESDSKPFPYADSHINLADAPSSHSGTHRIHTAIGVVASLLCLTCITTCLHRRCCNPRARAARAARREERRTRCQRRCAARKQAWRDWWAGRGGCFCFRGRGRGGTGDYEEKRALILQQEAVLEHAMQDQIYNLRRQTRNPRVGPIDDVLSMVEEGRAVSPVSEASSSASSRRGSRGPPSEAETLPPYRSRSGSGRPPSYNEVDQYAGSVVTDGFAQYAPDGYISTDDHAVSSDDEVRSTNSIRSLRSFRSGRSLRTGRSSPASSVVELSPRHSSETLRTERSSV